jgi:predicted small lipoprotein YifL
MRYGMILALLVLAGCGQKGALYMPEDKQEPVVQAEPLKETAQ